MDSFIFYKSFYDAAKDLPAKQRGIFYDYIVNYAINGEEPTKNSIENTLFKLVKPQIDANKKRRENGEKGGKYGSLGGRPKKEKNPIGVIEKNPIGVKDKTPNDNVNVNVNKNENENINEREEDVKKSLKDFGNALLETMPQRCQAIMMNNKLTKDDLIYYLNRFCFDCLAIGKKHIDVNDFIHHFLNWLPTGKKKYEKTSERPEMEKFKQYGVY